MNNAEKFKQVFGLYATELWSMPEGDFLAWLNRAAETAQNVQDEDLISRKSTIESIRECAETAHDNHEWDMEQGYLNAIECVEEEPSAQPEQHLCRDCKWAKYYGNVDKNGNVESYWYCTNWYGGTDEEGYCHEWESR